MAFRQPKLRLATIHDLVMFTFTFTQIWQIESELSLI